MSQVYMPNEAHTYTLLQFENLANQSQDTQELRIRKSNQELSNTPLGFIARYTNTHVVSNNQVNQAFLHAITTDERYKCVAEQLRTTLSTTMPLNEGLTPAKVKSAVATANDMLRLYQEGSKLAASMNEHGIIPHGMEGEFASFYCTYCSKYPDKKPDLRDFGDVSQLTQEQQQLGDFQKKDLLRQIDNKRLLNLQEMLRSFFTQDGRLQQTGFYRFQPEDCGGDGQKAQKLNTLFAGTCNGKGFGSLHEAKNREDAVAYMFDVPNYKSDSMPTEGSILSLWKDNVHQTFIKNAGSAWQGCEQNYLVFCSDKDLDYLLEQMPKNASREERHNWLYGLENGVKFFLKASPQCMEPGHEAEISSLIKHLCTSANEHGALDTDTLWGSNAGADFCVLRQIENKACDQILKDMGFDSPLGLAALRGSEFRTAAANAIGALSNRTEADIQRTVQEQAQKFLTTYGAVLHSVDAAAKNLNEHQLDMLIRVIVPFANFTQTLTDAKSSDVTLLRQANLLSDKFFTPGMTAEDRRVVLKTLTDVLFDNKDEAGKLALCQNTKSRFENLLSQLQAIIAQPGTSKEMKECCDNTALLFNVLYNNMLEQVPEDRYEALLLRPKSDSEAKPELARQMDQPRPDNNAQTIRPVPRQATSAEIFTAIGDLEAKGEKSLPAYLLPIMEKTHCADVELLAKLSGHPIDRIGSAFKSIHKDGDYATDLKHFYSDLNNFGSDIYKTAQDFPQYSLGEITQLMLDMFIATHTDEQLAQTLDALQSPEAKLALSAMYNHAVKEGEACQTLSAKQQDIAQISRENQRKAFIALGSLTPLMKGIATKLGRQEPEPLTFDPEVTMRDLPKQDQLDKVLPTMFRAHLNSLDTKLFSSKVKLTENQYTLVKDFFADLKLPDGSKIGRYGEMGLGRNFALPINPDLENDEDPPVWNVETLAVVVSFKIEDLAHLLERTQGKPSAAELWGVLHGGNPPQNLSLDNLAETLMQRMNAEVDAFKTMVGNETNFDSIVTNTHDIFGIPLDLIMDKFSNVQHEDVTLTMNDQKLAQGIFTIGTGAEYLKGQQAYGFGNDFVRASMPPGAKLVNTDGCKITIVNNGQEEVFTQKEYRDFTAQEAAQGRTYGQGVLGHPYMDKIVESARNLCQNDAQLSSVGYCTTQAVQMSLRNAVMIYKDVSGGSYEHTALDHRIEKQDDGSVKVTIREKPGSLFKFNMEISVDTQGLTTMTKGEITFPSLDKWNAHKQAHPEDRLK